MTAQEFKDYFKVDYRNVFIEHRPMDPAERERLKMDNVDCVMCDESVHPDERGCVKCLTEAKS